MPAKHNFLVFDDTSNSIQLQGAWTTHNFARISQQQSQLQIHKAKTINIDGSNLIEIDTSGALILLGLVRSLKKRNVSVEMLNFKSEHWQLFQLISRRMESQPPHQLPKKNGLLENIGLKTWEHLTQAYLLLSFVGEATSYIFRSMTSPQKIRWRLIVAQIEETGVNAIPIVGLLSFLLGIVIGYQGGAQLRDYGANIFVVELVSLTMLRELAPMMTAIIVAGRTGSAFTAQIGAMKITEEINAMRTIGMEPMEILVLPRILGLLITLPLLIVFADIMGVLGGMVMAATMLDVSFSSFLQRLPEAVSVTSFLLGIGKAPVFALIIAVVGCFQGLQVQDSGESVGRQTTISVVQAIFILILADALFSIIFSLLGI